MNTITTIICFENNRQLESFYDSFENIALKICRDYDSMEVWVNAKMLKDHVNHKLAIISIGAWVKSSNQEKAANEIIATFENMVKF